MDITLNAQAFINVSKKRMCGQADVKAQRVWNEVVRKLKDVDEPLYNNCVPECIYSGFCREKYPCNNGKGRVNSITYKKWRKSYIGNRPTININDV